MFLTKGNIENCTKVLRCFLKKGEINTEINDYELLPNVYHIKIDKNKIFNGTHYLYKYARNAKVILYLSLEQYHCLQFKEKPATVKPR